jgi:hypothetical protein
LALLGKAYSAPVGLRPASHPISFVTRGALDVFTQRLVGQLAPEKVIVFGFPRDLHLRQPEGKASV